MRMSPENRYAQLLNAAVDVADSDGFMALRHSAVATRAGVVKGTVFHHFKTIEALRNAVMQVAVDEKMLSIVAAGITVRNPVAMCANTQLKQDAVASMIK